jgi:hypothetical protein
MRRRDVECTISFATGFIYACRLIRLAHAGSATTHSTTPIPIGLRRYSPASIDELRHDGHCQRQRSRRQSYRHHALDIAALGSDRLLALMLMLPRLLWLRDLFRDTKPGR